ncbi:MAG TPA: peptidoglycan-associated lipoprotein [Alphaproteobacteria bacterium]|nr:peptidoglycan-associated lipoprotein [Alphaproteobacteria bacterium]
MLKRTFLAILAPLVLVACDPQVRANEQEPAANTAAAAAPDQFFQQSPAPLLGSQPGQVLLTGNNPGPQQIPLATANVYSPTQFASGASQVGLRADVGDRVFFTTDSAVLDPRGAGVVDQLAAWMRQYPSTTLRIEGHADERGTRDYNIALGDQRATAIRNRLLQLGIASERLSTVSYGKERPVASGSTPTVWAQNRRAVFVVL